MNRNLLFACLIFVLSSGIAWSQDSILERLYELERRVEKLETTPPAYGLWQQSVSVMAPNWPDGTPWGQRCVVCKFNVKIASAPECFEVDESFEFVRIKQDGVYFVSASVIAWSSGSGSEALADVALWVNDEHRQVAGSNHLLGGSGNYFGHVLIAGAWQLKRGDRISVRIHSCAWFDINVKANASHGAIRPVHSHPGATLSMVRLGPFRN